MADDASGSGRVRALAPRVGASVALGAGAGMVAGLLVAGAAGLALGIVVGAAAGVVVGAARDALVSHPGGAGPAGGAVRRLDGALGRVWARRGLGALVAAAVAVTWALVVGRWTPRGPLTTPEALWSIVVSLVVGIVAGLTTRSRWAVLAGPVLFAVVVELVRVGVDGPTVDRPRLTTYGLIALVVGRGVHGALSLLPMALGASSGAAVARALRSSEGVDGPEAVGGGRVVSGLRRVVAVVSTVALVALTAAVVRPARTDPIVDDEGRRVEDGIAELTTVEVDGREMGLMIRGHDLDNPVLLYLAGGPGGAEMGAMRRHLAELEEHFTVVTWDQRGTGKSYPGLDPSDGLTLESAVDDTLAVTDHLLERFDRDRIHLVGQSWGSVLGVLAVLEAPERYEAYVGVGQMVSFVETDRIIYEDTLAWAEAEGRDGLVDELRRIGPPPYDSVLDYETALSHEHEVYPYDRSGNSEGTGGFSENLFVEEYALLEQLHLMAGFLDTFAALYPRVQGVDLRRDATRFEVPVFFVQGAHEARGRAEPFEEWYPTIEAPAKDVTHLDTSGHRPLFEQPDELVAYMVDTVLASGTPS